MAQRQTPEEAGEDSPSTEPKQNEDSNMEYMPGHDQQKRLHLRHVKKGKDKHLLTARSGAQKELSNTINEQYRLQN